ncbi:restriction endonuclease [Actinomadura sp. NPDC048032]|uniref:restriction endonuclease n=1 Tax=Actinomadura sp. NPDC048032 TaxID=3155747 RepID=UPI0033C0D086
MSDQEVRAAPPSGARTGVTPAEFEEFVADRLLGSAAPHVSGLSVTLHEKVAGSDGTYDLDATVRYRFAGMDFLVVVEAKHHRNPIKRELVQVLHQKVQSVGAHKGVMVSTATYQSGAVAFARAHGIALVTVTDGRFLFETRDVAPTEGPAGSGPPPFLVHCHAFPGGGPGTSRVVLMAPDDDDYPRQAAEILLGCPFEGLAP